MITKNELEFAQDQANRMIDEGATEAAVWVRPRTGGDPVVVHAHQETTTTVHTDDLHDLMLGVIRALNGEDQQGTDQELLWAYSESARPLAEAIRAEIRKAVETIDRQAEHQ